MSDGDVRNFRKFIYLSEFGSREHDHITSCAGGGRQRQYVVQGLLVKKVSERSSYYTIIVCVILLIPWILCKKSPQRRVYDLFKGWCEDSTDSCFEDLSIFPQQESTKNIGGKSTWYEVPCDENKTWSSGGCSGCRPCAPALTTSSKGHLGGSPHRSLQRYKAVIWSELRLLLQRLSWGEPIIGHHLALQPKQSQLWDAILLWWQCWRASLQHREHWWDQWYIRQNGLMLLWAHFAMLGFQKHLVQIPLPHTTLSFGMCKFFLHNKVVQCKDTFCSLHFIFTTAKYLNERKKFRKECQE